MPSDSGRRRAASGGSLGAKKDGDRQQDYDPGHYEERSSRASMHKCGEACSLGAGTPYKHSGRGSFCSLTGVLGRRGYADCGFPQSDYSGTLME